MKLFAPLLAIILLAGCVSAPPPEFAVYTASFDQSKQAAAAVIEVWEPIEKASRPAKENQFDPSEAAYIADEGRPAITLLIERGFAAVAEYNEILTRYAGGESATALKPATSALSSNVGALAVTVGLSSVVPGANAVIAGLETLASALLAVSDRAEFQRAISQNSGKVDAFLAVTRDFTADMYRTANNFALNRQEDLLSDPGLTKDKKRSETQQINADLHNFRKMLASWVLTIDSTRESLRLLEAAVAKGQSETVSLAMVAFWTGEINRHAEAVKFAARNISQSFKSIR